MPAPDDNAEKKDDVWSRRYYLGATPGYPKAHTAIEATLPAHRSEWPRLLKTSFVVAEQLAKVLPNGEILKNVVVEIRAGPPAPDPLSSWIEALGRLHDIPHWPSEVESKEEGWIRVRLTLPYRPEVARWAEIALEMIWLAARALKDGTAPASPELWEKRLAALGSDLPAPGIMRMHAAFDAHKLLWRWLEGEETVVGTGSRQQLVRGIADDPDGFARGLAARGIHVPIYTVTGSIGKTTTLRLLIQLLSGTGLRLGIQASDGAWADGKQLAEGDCIGGRASLSLLKLANVDAGVLEFGRGGLIKRGFPFQQTDVGVLLNVAEVHLGVDGADTLDDLARVKALTLAGARLAVLNREDPHCRRIGESRQADSCVWFGVTLAEAELRDLSRTAHGALGVRRDPAGAPLALVIWRGGKEEKVLPLDGVAPYHGALGEKTLEELLASVGAAWFGPVPIEGWDTKLQDLRLDSENHQFRTSLHRRGDVLFVLDKAGEAASLFLLESAIEEICRRHGVKHRIAVLTRPAQGQPELHKASCAVLHRFMDEFICFDRLATYENKSAFKCYAPGSIPVMLKEEFERLNRVAGEDKPAHVTADWAATDAFLRERLPELEGPVLVLINQPGTSSVDINVPIVEFVSTYEEPAEVA